MEFPELLRKNNVKMLIEKELNFIYNDEKLPNIIQSLIDTSYSYCVVLDRSNNGFLGLISENDILLLAEQGRFDKNLSAGDLADGYDITAKMDSSIASIVKKMYKSDFKHVLIQDDKSDVQGVVSVRDFVYHLIEYFPETVYNVLPGKKMSTEDREGA